MRQNIFFILTNFVVKISCGGISGDFTPVSDNLIEEVLVFGPEYYVSFELSITSWPGSGGRNVVRFISDGSSNIINVLTQSNQDLRVVTIVDGSSVTTDISGSALNTFYRIEILQTQVVDKVGSSSTFSFSVVGVGFQILQSLPFNLFLFSMFMR